MIVLIGGEKGGTGKTTISTNLAAMRSAENRRVILIDTDIQGSAGYWAAVRKEEENIPAIDCVQEFGKKLQNTIEELAKRYEDIIIDAGGRDAIELRAGLVMADKAYIPIQPSQFDVWTLERMESLIEQAIRFNKTLRSFITINRASTNPSVNEAGEIQEVAKELRNLKLTKSVLRNRIVYRKAAKEGASVNEFNPKDQKAIKEITNLYREIFHD